MNPVEQRFQSCLSSILEHEGGLTQDKRDPGGTTNWGISLRYLKSMGLDLNKDGMINDEDVIGLHKDGAEAIYRKYWWDKYHYASFNELLVVEKVFDLAVNMGAMTAHKILQRAVNLVASQMKVPKLIEDGILGPKTFGLANQVNACQLRQTLRDYAEMRYLTILNEHPNMEWARNGWMARGRW